MREGAYRIDEETGKTIWMDDAIMELELGRSLEENERVVHVNGDAFDNRRANLRVIRVADLRTVAGAGAGNGKGGRAIRNNGG